MRTLFPLLGIACCALVLNCSGQAVQQGAASDGNQKSSVSEPASQMTGNLNATELPDSPGTVLVAQQRSDQTQSGQPAGNPAPPATNAQETQQKPQRPVGTAAAEAPKVSGITAAQPAGIAIAPAKQKRMRTIVLKVGAIVGAGAAVGTVIALSAGTSSKPPGAH